MILPHGRQSNEPDILLNKGKTTDSEAENDDADILLQTMLGFNNLTEKPTPSQESDANARSSMVKGYVKPNAAVRHSLVPKKQVSVVKSPKKAPTSQSSASTREMKKSALTQ